MSRIFWFLALLVLWPLLIASPVLAQGYTPAEAVKRMKLPEGFSARCVASEPMIRQPLSISFDDRGRMWVLQYLQYPNPAGLKAVKQDQYLRTIWDRVPEPPPKGPRGADRLTICYDPDERGVFRKSKDFVSGLNLASGFCLAGGGVYVLQSPYLLFYADQDGDDVPDGDPEVLLTGFGFDDTHSVANSLQFGPDGWLYGAAGSTSTSKIKNPARPEELVEFQQGVWRYHPKTKRFELFSEGGGNTFGLDFDKNGQCITGTNWGGLAMLHQMQGAYYVKGFSKHGPLHNPHTYGYFEHVPYKNFQGGHVTCGGVMYEADVYPKQYCGQYIAGNLLSNCVNWHKMAPRGASFTAEHGGTLLAANDTWCRPVDLQLGPDGCIYMADWYDKRAAHLDPIDDWDKTNGRVYRIEYRGEHDLPRYPTLDLRRTATKELLEFLSDLNVWYRREARRLLAERHDPAMYPRLLKQAREGKGQIALESLWALHVSGGTDLAVLQKFFTHPDEHVRAWAVRLVGDDVAAIPNQSLGQSHPAEEAICKLARHEKSPVVQCQIACTARRLPVSTAIKVIKGLMERAENAVKQHEDAVWPAELPLLMWWAVEDRCSKCDQPANAFQSLSCRSPMFGPLSQKIGRRLMADDIPDGQKKLAILLVEWGRESRGDLLHGIMDADWKKELNKDLLAQLKAFFQENPRDETLLGILARAGDRDAIKTTTSRVKDDQQPEPTRLHAINMLRQSRDPAARDVFLGLLDGKAPERVQLAALAALEGFEDPRIAEVILANYSQWPVVKKKRALQAVLTRPHWARMLFQAYDVGKFPRADLTLDHARLAVALRDKAVTALVEKHFGKIAAATPGEKQARIGALISMMSREKAGDPAQGKVLFTKTCAVCHQFHGEGNKVGPDLTSADRKNRMYMLASIVDPSGYIRPEFMSYTINTHDGRTLVGLVAQQAGEGVSISTFANGKVEQAKLMKADIDTMLPSPVSMMPEKLLDAMSNDEVRHLFAYLASDAPTPPSTRKEGERKENKGVQKLRIALVSGSLEYKSDETLAVLQKQLEEKYPVECVRFFRKTDTDIPGIEKILDCDLAIFFTRRLKLEGAQLDVIKMYCDSGKPILGIRTASHGFQNWLEMDRVVFGGNYNNHYGAGPKTEVIATAAGKDHPILRGVQEFSSPGSLYKNHGTAPDIVILQTGKMGENREPLTWVRERKVGDKTQRIFYTSLGHVDDFANASFMRLLFNAVGWCVQDETTFAK